MKINSQHLLFALFFLFRLSTNCVSQNISYSERDRAEYSSYHIIGQVKNHIIVWRYNNADNFQKSSEIIVYDLGMHILNKIKTKVLGDRAGQKNFINNIDSFQVIFQSLVNTKVVYKQATYDENGNCLNVRTLNCSNDAKDYQFLSSSDGKSFALINTMGNDSLNFLKINYTFISSNANHSGFQIFPFNFKTSKIGNGLIDDNNLIFSTSENNDSSNQLTIFKLNLLTDSMINTIRPIQDGYLIGHTITINSLVNDYVVSARWAKTGEDNSGIFLWRLNKDLSDKTMDTVIEKNEDSSSIVFNTNNFSVDTYQNPKQTKNVFVFLNNVATVKEGNFFSPQSASNYSQPQFNPSLTAPMANPSDNSNGVIKGVLYGSFNKVSNFQPSGPNNNTKISYIKSGKMESEKSKISILKLSTNNKILDKLTFDASIDKYVVSNITSAKVVTGANSFYILFNQPAGKNLETYGYIKANTANLQYTYNHIILMNLKYKLLLGQGVQINDNTLIVPCSQNEFISFAKIVFE